MGVSVFTFLMSLLWCNVFILLSVLCQRTMALKYGVNLILAMIAVGIVRLLIPIEVPSAFVVRSESIMPFFQHFFSAQVFEIRGFSVDRFDIFLAIWIIGSAVYLLFIAWTIFQQNQKVHRMKIEDYPRASKLAEEIKQNSKSKCRVLISPEVKTPMLIGYFLPIILLPPLTLTDDDLRYVLMHEWNHFIHGHLWIKLLFNIFCALLWWNPLVYMAKNDLDYILEVSCDRYAVRELSTKERIKYVEATTNVMKQLAASVTRQAVPSIGFVAAVPEKIVQRCELILFPPKEISKRIKVFTVVFLTFLVVLSYAFVFQTLYAAPLVEPFQNDSIRIDSEDAYLQQTPDGKFILYIDGEPADTLEREDIDQPSFSDLPVRK